MLSGLMSDYVVTITNVSSLNQSVCGRRILCKLYAAPTHAFFQRVSSAQFGLFVCLPVCLLGFCLFICLRMNFCSNMFVSLCWQILN